MLRRVFLSLLATVGLAFLPMLKGCTPVLPSFGNYGGPPRAQADLAVTNVPNAEKEDRATCEARLKREGTYVFNCDDILDWSPTHVRFSPDGRRIAVNLCRYEEGSYCRIVYYWIAEDRWEEEPRLPKDVSVRWPAFSPDGKTLAFAQSACDARYVCPELQSQLATLDLDSGTITRYPIYGSVRFPEYSPDGSRLAYWRLAGVGRLASGRLIGRYSVFELLPAAVTLQAMNEAEQKKRSLDKDVVHEMVKDAVVTFANAYSGPHYIGHEEQIVYCGRLDLLLNGERKPNTWETCILQDRTVTARYDVEKQFQLFDRRHLTERQPGTPGARLVHGFSRSSHFFADTTSGLAFVDREYRVPKIVGRLPLSDRRQTISADLSRNESKAVALYGAWLGDGKLALSKSYYARSLQNYGKPDNSPPQLNLVDLETGAVKPLFWPNLALPGRQQ